MSDSREEALQQAIDRLAAKRSWPKPPKERAIEVIILKHEVDLLVEECSSLKVKDLELPAKLIELGRRTERLGVVYRQFAQELNFTLLRKPEHGTQESEQEESSKEAGGPSKSRGEHGSTTDASEFSGANGPGLDQQAGAQP